MCDTGLRGLLEAMLHGDPYQRPHSFEARTLYPSYTLTPHTLISHRRTCPPAVPVFLCPSTTPTHLHQVLDHPFLRPLRQPQDTLLGDLDDEAEQGGRVMLLQVRRGLLQQAQHQHQQEEPPTTPVLRGLPPPGTPSSSSSSSPLIMSPQLLAVQSEERPLEVYVAYMDLAEINDGRAAVVVCGRREGMKVGCGCVWVWVRLCPIKPN